MSLLERSFKSALEMDLLRPLLRRLQAACR